MSLKQCNILEGYWSLWHREIFGIESFQLYYQSVCRYFGNTTSLLRKAPSAQCDAWFSALYKYSYILTR